MQENNANLFPNLTHEVVSGIKGFKLDTYIVALEGWRRGLKLKWYKNESEVCKMSKLNSSTHGKFFSLTSHHKTHYFFRSRGDKVSNESVKVCQNKDRTKQMLDKKGVPTPQGKVFTITDDKNILKYAKSIKFPVVIKPLSGSMGRGVYINIRNVKELKEILKNLKSDYKYSKYIVEKYYPGKEYRMYVVGDKVVAATNRVPANITGDGKNTVKKLINSKNKERKKNPYLASKPIKVDHEVNSMLKESGYKLDSIPKKGETVFLRAKSNLSSGGDPIDETDELSDEVKQIAVDALKALPSIPHAGVDVIVDPSSHKKGVVLEVNSTAEISFHLFPLRGKARDIPAAMIDYYFPETIHHEKTNLYFDFNSILEPLKTWAVDELVITQPLTGAVVGKKYTVTGKVKKVGYMNWIKRQALTKGLHGYAKLVSDNQIEIVVFTNREKNIDGFKNLCYKGSKKSKVDKVEQQDIQLNEPCKMGFELILENSSKK